MTLYTRQDLTIIFAILGLACAAAFLSIKLTRAKGLPITQISLTDHRSFSDAGDLLGRARLTTVAMMLRI
jgi:hypothetical protein